MTFGNNGLVPWRPFRNRTKSCLAIEPANSVRSPTLAPLLSLPTASDEGARLLTPATDDDNVRTTPDAAMMRPRTMGTHDPEVEEPWMPADEKIVEPADSDMKQPRK